MKKKLANKFSSEGGQFTNKVTKTLPIILIIFLITFVIGITIAIYNYTKTGNQNAITTGNVSMSFMESTNVINITNALPMGDVEGKVLDKYFDFSVTTNLDSVYDVDTPVYYEIELEPLSVDSGYTQLSNNQIKVYLENRDTNKSVVEPLLIDGLGISTNNENNKMLYYTSHNHKSNIKSVTTNYRLRAWIDYNVNASSWTSSTKNQYKFRININSHGYNVRYTTPETCFSATLDETTNTAVLGAYDTSCGTDVVIPDRLPTKTYNIIENPSTEQVESCNNILISAFAMAGQTITKEPLGDVCSGGTTTSAFQNLTMAQLINMMLNMYGYSNVSQIIDALDQTGILDIRDSNQKYTIMIIGVSAFYSNNLTSVAIPDSVTTIGDYAFRDNNLTSVVIPDSVTTIGDNTFDYLELDNESIMQIELAKQCFGTTTNETAATITAWNCTDIKNLVIPSTIDGYAVKTIEDGFLFEGVFSRKDLTSVVIPDSVTSIGDNAFDDNNLTSVTIPDSVTTIGDRAFRSNNLTSVTIPDSVTTIGNNAFQSNNLTSVVIPNSVTTIGDTAFNNNFLTDEQAYIYKRTDTNKDGIAEIDYTTIISYGGANKNIIIPNSVTTIGEHAFYLNNLTSVTIPDSVTSIGYYAFQSNNLTSVTIPDSVTTIGDSAFASNNLTSVTIPDSVTSIGASAFRNNYLRYVVIGKNSNLTETTGIDALAFESVGVHNENLTIYNNSGKKFKWYYVTQGRNNSTDAQYNFVTGTVPSYTDSYATYNEVTITTGYPE